MRLRIGGGFGVSDVEGFGFESGMQGCGQEGFGIQKLATPCRRTDCIWGRDLKSFRGRLTRRVLRGSWSEALQLLEGLSIQDSPSM